MSALAPADALANLLGGALAGIAAKQAARAEAPAFPHLTRRVKELAEVLDASATELEPPAQQRREAFSRLLREPEKMGSHDWKLLAWGLSDRYGDVRVLEHERAFPLIRDGFESRLAAGRLTRRMWFGLLSSYFSWRPEPAAASTAWEWLRAFVQRAFGYLKKSSRAVRAWMTVVDTHQDVFGDTPGASLGGALANQDMQALEDFRTRLPVPPESWFWRSMVEEQLRQLGQLPDEAFMERIAPMLALATQLPTTADTVLAGLLARYEVSTLRDQPHPALKAAALERWGSPQIGSSRSRWSVSASESVCQMVMRWFAKEDLETFFKLLQGESGVDQDRLDYWLRFVGQIGYTRIVMGSQAWNERSRDFVEFREKNRGRISQLRGGSTDNNAFVMKIQGYVIVEFSKKGHACYFRPDDDKLPFHLDASVLDLNGCLRGKSPGHEAIPHLPTLRGWWTRYDAWLAFRGIYPDSAGRGGASAPGDDTRFLMIPTRNAGVSKPAAPQASGGMPGAAQDRIVDSSIREALRYAQDMFVVVQTRDSRSKGGPFWIELQSTSPAMDRKLLALGFTHASGKGYWIK